MNTLKSNPSLLKKDLKGQIIIITGANRGIGYETAKQIAKQGATVILACRNLSAAKKVSSKLTGLTHPMHLDLGNISSIKKFATNFKNNFNRLDALINNAGIMWVPHERTSDGFEKHFGVNHLGHFLLTELLIDILKESAPSRIICVSSAAHDCLKPPLVYKKIESRINFDDINFLLRSYNRSEAYCQSKLANVLHAFELSKRLQGTAVTAVSLHPGFVRTKLVDSSGLLFIRMLRDSIFLPLLLLIGYMWPSFRMISPKTGSQTILHCLLHESVPDNTGSYYSSISGGLYRNGNYGGWPMKSPNPQAFDERTAIRLRRLSQDLVTLKNDH